MIERGLWKRPGPVSELPAWLSGRWRAVDGALRLGNHGGFAGDDLFRARHGRGGARPGETHRQPAYEQHSELEQIRSLKRNTEEADN